MPKVKEVKPTHRAHLANGESVEYAGAHPTHWSFGGVDSEGNRDGSRVRVVPVSYVEELPQDEEEDEDGE